METKETQYYCDKETFLKLKEVNKVLTEAKHAYAAWVRAKRKTVNKIPVPDLSKYSMFIKEYTRGKCPYKIDWSDPRSHKSNWLKGEDGELFGAYKYYDTNSWEYSYNLTKKERGDRYNEEMAEEKWYYLDTYFIDESYSICRKPISDENSDFPKLSRQRIDELYNLLDKQCY